MKDQKNLSKFESGIVWGRVLGCGVVAGSLMVGGLSVSCSHEKKAERDKKKLELVGYEMNQEGFLKAAAQDDLQALRIFQENKFHINQRDANGKTAAHYAAENGSVRALSFLSQHGLEVNVLDKNEVTPLMLAAGAGELEAIEFLLKSGAEADLRDKMGKFALLYAIEADSEEAIRLLAPHARYLLDTALLYAADQGRAKAIKPLVQYGASVYARSQGETSLMIAAKRGHVKVIKALLQEGANSYAISDSGKLARDYADGNEAVLNALRGDGEAVEGAGEPIALEWSEDELEEVVKKAMARFHQPELEKFAQEHAKVDAPSVKDGAAKPKVALPKLAKIPETVAVKPLQGKRLNVEINDAEALKKAVSMSGYAEKPLPIVVQAEEPDKVEVKDLRNPKAAPVPVQVGSKIGMTGLKVKKIKKRIVNSKLTGGMDKEMVTLVVQDARSGREQELYAGYESIVSDAVAVVRMNGSGEYLIVRRGDVFYDAKGVEYKVMDVNEREVVVENRKTQEVILLPLLGIKHK